MTLLKHDRQRPRTGIRMGAKEPRLNIRYQNFEIIDEIELDARRLGLKKNSWIKLAIQEKLDRDRFMYAFEGERVKGDFETRYILRKLGGAALSSEAKSRASDYIQKVMSDDL